MGQFVNESAGYVHLRVLVAIAIGEHLHRRGISPSTIWQSISRVDLYRLARMVVHNPPSCHQHAEILQRLRSYVYREYPFLLAYKDDDVTAETYDLFLHEISENQFKGEMHIYLLKNLSYPSNYQSIFEGYPHLAWSGTPSVLSLRRRPLLHVVD